MFNKIEKATNEIERRTCKLRLYYFFTQFLISMTQQAVKPVITLFQQAAEITARKNVTSLFLRKNFVIISPNNTSSFLIKNCAILFKK